MIQRTISLLVLTGLLSTACTAGIVKQEDLTSTALVSPLVPTATVPSSPILSATNTPRPIPTPTPMRTGSHSIELVNHIKTEDMSNIFVQGSYAYIGKRGLMIVQDISDPTHPTYTSQIALPIFVEDIYVSSGYAYVITSGSCAEGDMKDCITLRVLDVSDPSAPSQIGGYTWPMSEQMPWAISVAAVGHAVYVADASRSLMVLDVSDPANPLEVSPQDENTWDEHTWDVAIAGDRAYVLYTHGWNSHWRLRVLDISTPTAPVEIGLSPLVYDEPSYALNLKVAGDQAYVTDVPGLHIMDISNPGAPVEVGFYVSSKLWAATRSMAVANGYVYVFGLALGIQILDVSNPTAPVEVGLYDLQDMIIEDIAVVNDYVYVLSATDGLYILRHVKPESELTTVAVASPAGTQPPQQCVPSSPAHLDTCFVAMGIESMCIPTELGTPVKFADWDSAQSTGGTGRMFILGFVGWGDASIVYSTYDFRWGTEYDTFATREDRDAVRNGTVPDMIEVNGVQGFVRIKPSDLAYGGQNVYKTFVFPFETYYVAVVYNLGAFDVGADLEAVVQRFQAGEYPHERRTQVQVIDLLATTIRWKSD